MNDIRRKDAIVNYFSLDRIRTQDLNDTDAALLQIELLKLLGAGHQSIYMSFAITGIAFKPAKNLCLRHV